MNKCSFCKGRLESGNVNHVIDFNNLIIIIKNVPAQICNQCGEYYIEHLVALNVEKIVDDVKNNGAEVIIINYFDKVA